MADPPDQNARRSNRKGKRSKPASNVIHVRFGPDGPHAAPQPDGGAAAPSVAEGGEPVTGTFSRTEVERLLGVSAARLRALDRAGIVSPSGARHGKRAYTFQDLIALRATRELLEQHVTMRDVARAIGALRAALPRVRQPLRELRIVSDGARVIVRTGDGVFEPVTGQMVLDFQVATLRDDAVRVLRPKSGRANARAAFELYTRASQLDEDPRTFDEAEALYRRAIAADPTLAIAYTNLGNIKFRRGEIPTAEQLYERALQLDERQPEAHYNLGYVMLERGDAARATEYFERAIAVDPRFADAHFNLAMAYEQTGEYARARAHWKKYLALEPVGTWADIARKHLS